MAGASGYWTPAGLDMAERLVMREEMISRLVGGIVLRPASAEREADAVADGGPCSDFCRACCRVCRGMGGTAGWEYSMVARREGEGRKSNQRSGQLGPPRHTNYCQTSLLRKLSRFMRDRSQDGTQLSRWSVPAAERQSRCGFPQSVAAVGKLTAVQDEDKMSLMEMQEH